VPWLLVIETTLSGPENPAQPFVRRRSATGLFPASQHNSELNQPAAQSQISVSALESASGCIRYGLRADRSRLSSIEPVFDPQTADYSRLLLFRRHSVSTPLRHLLSLKIIPPLSSGSSSPTPSADSLHTPAAPPNDFERTNVSSDSILRLATNSNTTVGKTGISQIKLIQIRPPRICSCQQRSGR
jgi:hypothetical protein